MENKSINWEKIGIYIALIATFFTFVSHIIDLKERISKVEVMITVIERDINDRQNRRDN